MGAIHVRCASHQENLREGGEHIWMNQKTSRRIAQLRDTWKIYMTMTDTTTVETAVTQEPLRHRFNDRQQENIAGWLMVSPAVLLILGFLIVPFLMAFGLAFTNQRLITPNPTEYVGSRNFARLLTLRTLGIDPIVDEETGELVRDEDGNLTYPRTRTFTRNNPDHPELDGLQEWLSKTVGETRWVLLAGDAVFMRSLVNTFYLARVSVPVQAGLGLVVALLVNQKIRGRLLDFAEKLRAFGGAGQTQEDKANAGKTS